MYVNGVWTNLMDMQYVYTPGQNNGRVAQTIAGLDNRVAQTWFSPDGRSLAVNSRDRALRLFETATGRERLRLGGFDTGVYAVTFTRDGTRLLPIWIGQPEAESIVMHMHNVKRSRPLTHDLVRSLIVGMGAQLRRVQPLERELYVSALVEAVRRARRLREGRPSR